MVDLKLSPHIPLGQEEMVLAFTGAGDVIIDSRLRGLGDPNIYRKKGGVGEFIMRNINSTGGEIAFAKFRNVPWESRPGHWRAPDVDGVHVRTAIDGPSLIVRPDKKESPDWLYVLIHPKIKICGGEFKETDKKLAVYAIIGYIFGHEAKSHPEWYRTDVGEPAWFVPPQHMMYDPNQYTPDELLKKDFQRRLA